VYEAPWRSSRTGCSIPTGIQPGTVKQCENLEGGVLEQEYGRVAHVIGRPRRSDSAAAVPGFRVVSGGYGRRPDIP